MSEKDKDSLTDAEFLKVLLIKMSLDLDVIKKRLLFANHEDLSEFEHGMPWQEDFRTAVRALHDLYDLGFLERPAPRGPDPGASA